MIKPTIGRVVWYNDGGTQFRPALICFVWDDSLVNLATFSKDGQSIPITSVDMFQGNADECPIGHCCWMPYQQRQQAEKDKAS